MRDSANRLLLNALLKAWALPSDAMINPWQARFLLQCSRLCWRSSSIALQTLTSITACGQKSPGWKIPVHSTSSGLRRIKTHV
jgi:hypothetical protein